MGHITPKRNTGPGIAEVIINFIKTKQSYVEEVMCIGCDGTVTNTGYKGGVIRHIELQLNKPFQWLICLLHANELPLRHLFKSLDGATFGPKVYSGPIGSSLLNCEKNPVISFSTIKGNLPIILKEVVTQLSNDQKYLYEICSSIYRGYCSIELANRHPGNLSHARWITMANRILHFYISCETPTENLIILVEFIVKVYAPIWL